MWCMTSAIRFANLVETRRERPPLALGAKAGVTDP
jgi:hypothetical protein